MERYSDSLQTKIENLACENRRAQNIITREYLRTRLKLKAEADQKLDALAQTYRLEVRALIRSVTGEAK